MAAQRHIRIRSNDVLIINGYALEASVLMTMLEPPDKRVLWAFVHDHDVIQPVPYSEEHCIWLTDGDLVRHEKD